MTRTESIGQAKNRLSALVNRVAHGRERIILTSRGNPKAGLVGLDDMAALEDLPPTTPFDDRALKEADSLAARIHQRRRGKYISDSYDDLAAIRAGESR